MIKKKLKNIMSSLQSSRHSLEILLLDNLDKDLQLKEKKELREKALMRKHLPKRKVKQEKFYLQNLLHQMFQRAKEF